MKYKCATGNYVNVYNERIDGIIDVFLIMNEPNTTPTPEEITILHEVTENVIERYHSEHKNGDNSLLKKMLREEIENKNLMCLEYGFQIIINRK